MKKLTTTALVSSLMLIGTSAIAQISTSGNLNIGYRALSQDSGASSTGGSFSGVTKESQINFANKGKLNNGLDYAVGFALEFDGQDGIAGSNGWNTENTYIDLTSGGTTITLGADHIQNSDVNLSNILGIGYTAMHGVLSTAGAAVNGSYPQTAASNYGAYGIGVIQNIGVGNISANYTPSRAGTTASNDVFNNATAATYEVDESAVEFVFRGDLGVKGLTVLASIAKSDAPDGQTKNIKGQRLAAQYNFGKITVGIDRVKEEGLSGATTAAASNEERTGTGIGAAFAVTNNLSVGAHYAKAEKSNAGVSTNVDEKYKAIQIGYNFGPIALQVEGKRGENVGNSQGADADQIGLLLSSKF
jgi:hypothetical protein